MFKWEGHSEVDKYALSVYEKHFPESEALGDIRLIRNTRGLPEKLDLVTFGFPCQDLSVAGKRGGITASRSGLFIKAMRIIRAKKPSYIIFENVKGLFSSNEGKDIDYVLRTIARAGYDGQWQLLNTRWFLPQNRERIYFVGHLRGKPRPQIFPVGESGPRVDESQGSTQGKGQRGRGDNTQCAGSLRVGGGDTKDLVANCVSARYYKDGSECLIAVGDTGKNPQGARVYSPEGIATSLASQAGGGGAKTGLYAIPVLTPDRPIKRQNGRRFKKDGDDSFTLTGQDKHGVMVGVDIANTVNCDGYLEKGARKKLNGKSVLTSQHERRVRRLTPTECERLQGFPDNWTAWANRKNPPEGVTSLVDMISDSQRYKMMGNAVSVPVVKAVISNLLASGAKIENYLDLFSGVGGFRLGIEEAINEKGLI